MKAIYTVKDLQPLLGFKSEQGCRSFLLKLNLRSIFTGKKYFFYLSDLQENCPELVNSIIAAEQINRNLERIQLNSNEMETILHLKNGD